MNGPPISCGAQLFFVSSRTCKGFVAGSLEGFSGDASSAVDGLLRRRNIAVFSSVVHWPPATCKTTLSRTRFSSLTAYVEG